MNAEKKRDATKTDRTEANLKLRTFNEKRKLYKGEKTRSLPA